MASYLELAFHRAHPVVSEDSLPTIVPLLPLLARSSLLLPWFLVLHYTKVVAPCFSTYSLLLYILFFSKHST